MLKRSKAMSIATKKFTINEWVVRESGQLNQIDMVVASQIQTYVDNGLWGRHGTEEAPELATM